MMDYDKLARALIELKRTDVQQVIEAADQFAAALGRQPECAELQASILANFAENLAAGKKVTDVHVAALLAGYLVGAKAQQRASENADLERLAT